MSKLNRTERNRKIAEIIKLSKCILKENTHFDSYSQNDEETYIFKGRYFVLSSYFDVEEGPDNCYEIKEISKQEFERKRDEYGKKRRKYLLAMKLIDKKETEIKELKAKINVLETEIDELIDIAKENDTY